jgi:hypothetical protein
MTWGQPALILLGAAVVIRWLVTADLQKRLEGKAESGTPINRERERKAEKGCPPPHVGGYGCWLAPVKDLMQVAVWALAFVGNTIEWRGRRMRLRPDGTLIPT